MLLIKSFWRVWILKNIISRKHQRSRNQGRLNKSPLANYQKAYALLLLIRSIRNRAFHFENLLKILDDGRPRLSIRATFKKSSGVFSIMPNMIMTFLDDILKSFDENLVEYAKN